MSTRKTWLAVVAVALVLIAATAVWSLRQGSISDPASTPQELTVGYFLKAIGYAPYYVAQSKDWFNAHPDLSGWEIKHVEFGDRPTISQAFDSGDLQYLLSADIPAIISRAQGNDIRIVNLSGLVSLKWLVQPNSTTTSVADLAGKRVAFLPGTSSHYGYLETLEEAGLSESDLIAQHLTPPEARTAFESGQVESWIVWSPFYEQQLIAGTAKALPGTDYRYAVTGAASTTFIEEHPRQLRALVSVLERGKEWMAGNKVEARSIIAAATGQSPEVVDAALANIDYSARLDEPVAAMFQDMADFVAAQEKTRLGRSLRVREELISPAGN